MNFIAQIKNKKINWVDFGFDFGLIVKTTISIVETIIGTVLLFVSSSSISKFIHWITADELQENSHDFLANLILNFGHNFTPGAQSYMAIYLLSHGIVKLFALILLIFKITWAYPVSIAIFTGFVVYQMIEFFHNHSIFMLLVSIFDIFMIWLTIIEYRRFKAKNKKS